MRRREIRSFTSRSRESRGLPRRRHRDRGVTSIQTSSYRERIRDRDYDDDDYDIVERIVPRRRRRMETRRELRREPREDMDDEPRRIGREITTSSFVPGREIKTSSGGPDTKKRKFDGPRFTTAARKRQMREEQMKDGGEMGDDGEEKPEDGDEKVAVKIEGGEESESPEDAAENEEPVIKKSKRSTIFTMEPKKFVTMRHPDDPESSSDEESESESESDRRFRAPKLDVKTNDGALVLVRNLPPTVTGRMLLFELFEKFPGIEQVSIHTDKNGASTGTAEVAVGTVQQAKDVIRRCKNIVYRNHEIFMTMMGTSTINEQPAQEVITALPKELRKKRKKKIKEKERETMLRLHEETDRGRDRDRRRRRERSRSEREETEPVEKEEKPEKSKEKKEGDSAEEASPEEEEEVEPEPEKPPLPKPKKLRIASPVAIVPETRPWNWDASKPPTSSYTEQYIPPRWEENDETYYHVTMKKELQAHLPNLAER